jgi:hypothetical protein
VVFCIVDALGQSGGLIIGWSPACKAIFSLSLHLAIAVKLEVKDVGISLNVVNVYDPYFDRIPFWENLAYSGVLNDMNMVVSGDLNLTLSLREVWGQSLSRPTKWIFCAFFSKNTNLLILNLSNWSPPGGIFVAMKM